MSQPGTLPAATPVPTTSLNAVERTAGTRHSDGLASGEPTEAALSQSAGSADSGIDSKPCSYLSLFRSAQLRLLNLAIFRKSEGPDKLTNPFDVWLADTPISLINFA